jgi:DNA-binding response OmpR family regulator
MSNILVIDDDALVLRTIGIVLRGCGHKVVLVTRAAAGVAEFRTAPFDLVITDMWMPEQHGTETIAQLRRLEHGVKILAISGGFGDMGGATRPAHADATLGKPFGHDELALAVENLCR